MDNKRLAQQYTDRKTAEAKKAEQAAERLSRAGEYLEEMSLAHDLAAQLLNEVGFTSSEVPMQDRRGRRLAAQQFKSDMIPLGKLKNGRKQTGAEGFAQMWLNRGYEHIPRSLNSRTAALIVKTVVTERVLAWPTSAELSDQTLAFGVVCFTADGNSGPREEGHERCQNFDFIEELAGRFKDGSLSENEVHWVINEQRVDYPAEPLLGSLQTIQKAISS